MKIKLYSSMGSCVAARTKALLAVAGWIALTAAGWAASPSELLEQGIYAEETKGDRDAATNCYRQALAEARPGWPAAAQAQFRLGVCCYKKKDFASGAAAFDQVIKNYPEQKELVAQADDYLYRALPLLPAPWVDGEELRFEIKGSGGQQGSSVTFGPKQTAWFSTDSHRYMVKFADTRTAVVDGKTIGGDMRLELSAVTRRQAGEQERYRDAALGVSVMAPARWRIVRRSGEETSAAVSPRNEYYDRMFNSLCENPQAQSVLCFLDPDAACLCVADIGPLATLNESERQSLHTWAKEDFARSTKGVQCLRRPDERVAGIDHRRPAGRHRRGSWIANRIVRQRPDLVRGLDF